MLHIYYGYGKGKTTCAVGIAMRAAGSDRKVLFSQFLKGNDSGERRSMELIPNITLTSCPDHVKFVRDMTDEEKLQCRQHCRNTFEYCAKEALVGKYNMVIFDEIFIAIENNMLSESELFDFLANAPKNIEIVLTGHNPSEKILKLADYCTEMRKVAHPYDRGISARKGIEF